MKTRLHKIISIFLVAVMLLTAAPLSGFVGLDLNLDWLDFTTRASAATYSGTCGGNLTWTFDDSTGELSITGTGAMYNYNYNNRPWESCIDNIKSVVIGNSVTTIGEGAFEYCDSLKSITIPDSVTTIGYEAFASCDILTSVTIPDSVTTIGDDAFSSCTSLTSVTIPDSVTTIGDGAFSYCDSLTSVTIPDSVTTIGDGAFSYCDSLTNITVDAANQYYSSDSYGVLYNKDKTELIQYPVGNSRTSFKIPEGVTTIGVWAFACCDSLTSITIPDNVTTIGKSAFSRCDSLTSVTIPDSVTTIGDNAFEDCNSLTSVTIPDSVTAIGDNAFGSCTSLTNVTIPDSVTTIGEKAFSGCNRVVFELKKDSYAETYAKNNSIPYIYIYDGSEDKIISVTVTSKLSFEINKETYTMTINCNGNMLSFVNEDAPWVQYKPYIKNIIINDGCTSISANAFKNFGGIRSVTIPDSVTTIGSYAFYDCTGLTGITIPDSVTAIGNYAFECCYSLTGVTIPDSVTTIGDNAFRYCSSLTSVTIPDSVTTIGNYAFYNCNSLTSVTIPDSVTTIGNYAFYYCTGLTSVTIPDSVTTIGYDAFYYCDSLTSVTIPDSVTTIGYDAFEDCNSLTSVTMPVSASIGSSAFSGCNKVKKVTLTKGKGTFKNYTSSSCTNTPWYASTTDSLEVIIEDGVTGIGSYMFYCCENLGSLTLPESVKSIGNNSFAGCKSMEKLIVYNPDCTFGTEATSYYTTIVGYAGSTAEAYANEMGFDFELIEPCDHKNYHTERNEPTCTEEGLEKSVCDDCGSTFYYAELPKTGHTLETVVANPTCQHLGAYICICAVCDYAYVDKVISKVDHDMSWVVVSKPTPSADGEMHYKCSYCDLVEQTKVVPAFMIASNSIANINFETNTISGFDAGTTSLDGYISVENDDYAFVCDSDIIATGTVIELTDGDTVITEFTAVVFGDVNGDGWYDGTDSIIVSCLANGLLSKDDVSSAFYTAADCNHDGVIDSFDVAILEQAGLLLSGVDQSKSNEELATDDAFIEYLDLIDQSPETEEEPLPDEEVVETPETEELNLIEFIINIIKKLFELLISYLPIK